MRSTVSTYLWPGQSHLGFGAAGLVGEAARSRGAKQAFILADPGIVRAGLVEPVARSLEAAGVAYTVYDRIVPNPDVETVNAAGRACRAAQADIVIGVGGGSSLDTAKAVCLLAGAPAEASIAEYALKLGDTMRPIPPVSALPPFVAIPTTAGTGSEVTPWALITDYGIKAKFGIGGVSLQPTVALIDPELTLNLPPGLTAATGLDALSHCIEAYVSTNNNPALDPLILHAIERIGRSLRVAVAQGQNRQARTDMMEAAMIGGIAISSNWLGACHSLAHQLSSFADVPHGVAIALTLPVQMAYSLSGSPERYARIGAALDASHPLQEGSLTQRAQRAVDAVRELIADIGLPGRLQDVGVSQDLIPAMARSAYKADTNWMTNPLRVDEAVLEDLYRQAY